MMFIRDSLLLITPMRLLVHDYAGHPFQIQLSRELAKMGHEVLHAFAGSLQTPRGDLVKSEEDAASFSVREVAMDPEYARYKYSFIRRRNMEVAYGKQVAQLIRTWKPEGVISSNTPTETQDPILRATQAVNAKFVYWLQDFYSLAVDKLVRKKIPVLGGLIGNYYRRMEGRQLRASHQVVAITEDFSPILEEDFGVRKDQITVIPNWAPLETLPVCDKANEWSRRHGLADKFVYLYTGTLGMKHNPELLLGLAEQYRAQRQNPRGRDLRRHRGRMAGRTEKGTATSQSPAAPLPGFQCHAPGAGQRAMCSAPCWRRTPASSPCPPRS